MISGILDSAMRSIREAADGARRGAIAGAVCAVCGLAAVGLLASASLMALSPVVGPVYAQLIVAGAFLLTIAATIIWLRQSGTSRATPVASAQAGAAVNPDAAVQKQQMQFAQIAMIMEAAMLGYSMARRR